MKLFALRIWTGQFGIAIVSPALFFLLLAVWLRARFGLGLWIVAILGFVGILTSIQTTKSCLQSLRKAAEEAADSGEPPVSYNDHL